MTSKASDAVTHETKPDSREALRRGLPNAQADHHAEQADGKAAHPGNQEKQARGAQPAATQATRAHTGIRGDIASDHNPTDPFEPRR
jgi:hypothetical protein